MEFVSFAKIARLNRDCTITEKLDGTNASIMITEDGQFLIGSRTRWITPEQDNYGFAKWAINNKEELLKLGVGHHFGEWWGQGIQRNYSKQEKTFSLFNTAKWNDEELRPKCCAVVPTLYEGLFADHEVLKGVKSSLSYLREKGSAAAPGFMKPEGIIIWHHAARQLLKVTLEKDEEPKGFLKF